MLLNDSIIDTTTTGGSIYHLATVWLELDNKNDKYKIILTTPEDVLVLSFPDQSARTVWHQAINKSIIETLRQEGDDINIEDESSVVSAPVMRQAEYEWSRGELRGCVYKGGWVQVSNVKLISQ